MDKVQVLARSRSDFVSGVDELTFRAPGTLDKTEYGYQLRLHGAERGRRGAAWPRRYEGDGAAPGGGHVESRTAAMGCCWIPGAPR